ncbi:MAG: N-formylglutamate amidohydrolase [Planctomycetota bacterium]|jgi:formiminoglutamase
MSLPVLISVPHAGLVVPPEVRELCLLTPEQIRADSDDGAAEIYALKSEAAAFIDTDVPRAIVDLNRDESDRTADGVVKTHTIWKVPIYRQPLPEDIVEILLEKYYRPYHRRLRELSAAARICFDCHTMAAFAPPIAPDSGAERPHVCLGNAHNTCPQPLFEQLTRCFAQAFGEDNVTTNDPFAGGHIVRTHAPEKPWVQIELSRAEFMPTGDKHAAVIHALRNFCRTAFQ